MNYARHDEVNVDVPTAPAALFDHLDDQERLAAHMSKPSMMMMGGACLTSSTPRAGAPSAP